MKGSLLKIGLILCIIGTGWIALEFLQAQNVSDEFVLYSSSSHEVMQDLRGEDIGFYKIFVPYFAGEEIFVQILDRNRNVISEEVVQTKMSVGYFDYTDGSYYAKVTNISENQIIVEIEFGETNSKEMIPGGIVVLAGSFVILFASYIKLRNYKIAQPDENIS